jgi:hypothetical protein
MRWSCKGRIHSLESRLKKVVLKCEEIYQLAAHCHLPCCWSGLFLIDLAHSNQKKPSQLFQTWRQFHYSRVQFYFNFQDAWQGFSIIISYIQGNRSKSSSSTTSSFLSLIKVTQLPAHPSFEWQELILQRYQLSNEISEKPPPPQIRHQKRKLRL